MRRRHLVILVSAVTLLALVFLAAVSIGVGVSTSAGREQIRNLIQQQLGSRVRGHLYVGRVSGGLLTGLTIDSLAIRALDDSLLLSTGRLTVQYNPRDLLDRRLLLRNVEVEHPVLRLRQHREGDWNHQRIFRRGSNRPGVPGRGFGDFVVLDSVTVHDGAFILTRPWSPADSLTGAKRDSAIRVSLAATTREVRRSSEGLTHTYRWSKASAFLPHVRIAHPDSGQFGQEFVIERGRVEEQEPPFSFRNARGTVRRLGDSAYIDMPHFDLPASTGSAVGKVWWGSGLPTRYDIHIRGDSVSLNDVAWVYQTLPREGVGRMNLHIRNSTRNLGIMEYALTDLDVWSTKSRLLGSMTFVVGDTVLGVTDVNLRGAPINFDLVRTLAGEPLSVDWQGDLIGTVRGPGGPLTRFVVDSSNVTFRDAHVRGAVSRFSGRGELDILYPAFTVFRGFDASTSMLDLRSIQFLFPEIPKLGGTIAGSARLDSSWLDVRFSNANISHENGPGEPTRMTGSGRATWGEKFMTYDVALNAQPLSLPMMSRAYEIGLKGLFSGPIKAKGTSEDLQLTADLTGPGGRITYDGTVDAYPVSIAAHGHGRVEALELSQLIDRDKAPVGWITGDYRLDVVGDTNDLATLRGSAWFALERSEFDGVRIFPSRVFARFDDRRMFVDTLRVESTAATVDAVGAIGLAADRADSIAYLVSVDSLGGLRRYVSMLTTASRDSGAAPDSLAGALTIQGTLSGSLPALRAAGRVAATNVIVRRRAGRDVSGTFDIADVFGAPTGSLALRSLTLELGGVALDTLGVSLRLNEGRTGAFSVGARSINDVSLAAQGEFARSDTATLVSLRSLALVADSGRWLLAGPADIHRLGRGVAIDSLVLMNGRGARISLNGAVPDSGRARFLFRGDSIPLRDIGVIAQVRAPLSGWANVTAAGAGTNLAPVMTADARLSNVTYGDLSLERVTARADYANRRAQVQVDLARGQSSVLRAQGSLPLELRYFGVRLLDDSLQASIRTADATFDLVQAFVPGLRGATGRLVAAIDVGGSWKHLEFAGAMSVENGEATVDALGIRLKGVEVDLGLFGHADSLAVRRMVAWSGTTPADSISLSGSVAYRQLDNSILNLRLDAKNFHAIDKRTVARLHISTDQSGLRLRGPISGATLSGGVIVDRGTIFLPDPELARKQSVDLRSQFVDTANLSHALLPDARSKLFDALTLEGVRVTLGDEVSLRSPEADIKLAGSLNVQRNATRIPSLAIGGTDTVKYQPVLDGALRAERGTYTLNLLYGFQREFEVEGGGTIVFYPSPELAPELNISALHAVKRANQPDLRIRVRLTGPLFPNPIVSLESGESYSMSQTDLVSYLIFGMPSFALGDEQTKTTQLALQTLVPTGQAVTNQVLGRLLGSFADNVSLRPGAFDTESLWNAKGGDAFRYMLFTTRIGTEVQLSDNVFVSLSTGLCQLDRSNASTNTTELVDIANGLSGKLEYRFSQSTALKAGREPPASALNCGRSVTGRAFIPTPSQWGFSLFKSWRF